MSGIFFADKKLFILAWTFSVAFVIACKPAQAQKLAIAWIAVSALTRFLGRSPLRCNQLFMRLADLVLAATAT